MSANSLWLGVSILGVLGVGLRVWLNQQMTTPLPSSFPIWTFIPNLLGSFLIGFAFALSQNGILTTTYYLCFVGGFLGGLTTFSSLMLEGYTLIKAENFTAAIIYLLSSIILGLTLTALGDWCGNNIFFGKS